MQPLHELFMNAIVADSITLPQHSITDSDRWVLTVAAAAPDVGDLTIWDDGDELPVDIGRKYHSHFDERTAIGENKNERRANAAASAAQFVNDVLNDKVAFRIEYSCGQCRSSSSLVDVTSRDICLAWENTRYSDKGD